MSYRCVYRNDPPEVALLCVLVRSRNRMMTPTRMKKPPRNQALSRRFQRRGWDLNPRGTYAPAGFQDRCNLDGTDNQANGLQLVSDSGCTNGCTRETENDRGCTSVESASEPVDAELSKVIDAWPTLPEHLKAAVMALVATASR